MDGEQTNPAEWAPKRLNWRDVRSGRVALHLALGVVLTYAAAVLAAAFAPIVTMAYSCTSTTQRATLARREVLLWLRISSAPHGAHLQVQPLNDKAAARILGEEPRLDGFEDGFPAWSRLRSDWRQVLLSEDEAASLLAGWMWQEVLTGWPIPCLWGRLRQSWSTSQIKDTLGVLVLTRRLRWRTGAVTPIQVPLPLIPVPGRFAASVLFYAVASYAPLALFRYVRRRRRLRRGRCASCGYDLRASPTRCPECGAPVWPTPNRE